MFSRIKFKLFKSPTKDVVSGMSISRHRTLQRINRKHASTLSFHPRENGAWPKSCGKTKDDGKAHTFAGKSPDNLSPK
ncbi:hypothetical protein SUGI_0597840 [Cryptomeria japonica]|nr:hypothetical protein SUGI_0597840 [Cryptomeria japonica]